MSNIYEDIQRVTTELLAQRSTDISVDDFVKCYQDKGSLYSRLIPLILLVESSPRDFKVEIGYDLDRYIASCKPSASPQSDLAPHAPTQVPTPVQPYSDSLASLTIEKKLKRAADDKSCFRAFIEEKLVEANSILKKEADNLLTSCNPSEKVAVKKVFDELSKILLDENCPVEKRFQNFKDKIAPEVLKQQLVGIKPSLIEKVLNFFSILSRIIANKITFGLVAESKSLEQQVGNSVGKSLSYLRVSKGMQVLEEQLSTDQFRACPI